MTSIRDNIAEMSSLQPHWTNKNTPEMERRGHLIRHDGPEWLQQVEGLAAAIGIPSDDLICEGSDGTGQKTEVPWFRFASRERSPNARTGWYCVYLFEALGDTVYLALGQGSTDWTGTDFKPKPAGDLLRLSSWARENIADEAVSRSDLVEAIELNSRRSDLGPAYEAGTVVAFAYDAADLPSADELYSDALFMAGLLGAVYRISEVQPAPVGPSPEVIELTKASDKAAGKTYRKSGQGFQRTAAQREAVELHAMARVRTHYESKGWSVVDTSSSKPYDFICKRNGARLFVEVKGTTSDGASVVLTRNEVELHTAEFPHTALAVVHGVALTGEEHDVASGGELRLYEPFVLDESALTVISYTYDTTGNGDS